MLFDDVDHETEPRSRSVDAPARRARHEVEKRKRAGQEPRLDARTRDGITALLGASAVVVTVAATGACDLLDTKNPPLPNEAPNRGQFVGGIAIGAGPGSGGSGAGLGTGGTSTITSAGGGNPAPPNCACAASYALGDTCLGCFDSEQGTACVDPESRPAWATCATPSCSTLFDEPRSSAAATAGCVAMTLDERRPGTPRSRACSSAAAPNALRCALGRPADETVEAQRLARRGRVARSGRLFFAACLDGKNPPLPNEAPNRHLIFGSPGSGGGSSVGGGPADNCECVSAYVVAGSDCATCIVTELGRHRCADPARDLHRRRRLRRRRRGRRRRQRPRDLQRRPPVREQLRRQRDLRHRLHRPARRGSGPHRLQRALVVRMRCLRLRLPRSGRHLRLGCRRQRRLDDDDDDDDRGP